MMLQAASAGGPYQRSLLLVLGDHAQTLSGDHGGGSPEETDSLLLAFNIGRWRRIMDRADASEAVANEAEGGERTTGPSRGGEECRATAEAGSASADSSEATAAERLRDLVKGTWRSRHPADRAGEELSTAAPDSSSPGGICESSAPGRGGGYQGVMPQVDFAASLAASMGLPIPFGNIGHVDPTWWEMAVEKVGGGDGGATAEPLEPPGPLASYELALRINARQVPHFVFLETGSLL